MPNIVQQTTMRTTKGERIEHTFDLLVCNDGTLTDAHLAQHVGVKVSTVRTYVQALQHGGIPFIKHDGTWWNPENVSDDRYGDSYIRNLRYSATKTRTELCKMQATLAKSDGRTADARKCALAVRSMDMSMDLLADLVATSDEDAISVAQVQVAHARVPTA